MCEIIIDGKTAKFESSVLTQHDLAPYRESARHITICDSVTEIWNDAFRKFNKLKNVEISNSVKVIGETAFLECSALKTVAFPDSITELRFSVCKNCKSLENVVIPDSVTKIGDYAFWGCTSLKSINLPDTVAYVGNSAFFKCSSLKSINIPKSIIKIGTNVFCDCDNIRVKIKTAENDIISKMVIGTFGQIITVDIEGNEYPILTCQNAIKVEAMVITGHVDYAGGKLYSGYGFNGELDPQSKVSLYCYYNERFLFYDTTMDGFKEKLDFFNIC